MRIIMAEQIVEKVKELCIEANYNLGEELLQALEEAKKHEEAPLALSIIDQLIENAQIAQEGVFPICQDTGAAVFFVQLGQKVLIEGGSLEDAINEGVRQGYKEGYLRASMVADPLKRTNTKDNTPAIIHIELVPGDRLKLSMMAKGGGSENMGALKMLKPSDGIEGVKRFVIETVKEAWANPCPPIVVGVGIGGTFEKAALLAKKALLRSVAEPHPDPFYAGLERELLQKINDLGIGPQGLGGRVTALAVHIETSPCHIASLPVAVNINCHAARHKEVTL